MNKKESFWKWLSSGISKFTKEFLLLGGWIFIPLAFHIYILWIYTGGEYTPLWYSIWIWFIPFLLSAAYGFYSIFHKEDC